MKFNQFSLNDLALYKFIVIILLSTLCFPLLADSATADSLKHILKSSHNQKDECSLNFQLYKYFETIDLVDSMNVYAKKCLKACSLNKKEGSPIIRKVIFGQYKQGFASSINPIADSLLIAIEDPEIKLRLIIILAEADVYYEEKSKVEKYWSQAEIALTETKDDYSKFLYYNFWGFKNTGEGNIFAALQSYELARNFAEENSVDYLRNNSDLANLYLRNGENEKAKGIYYETLKKAKENDYFKRQCYIYYALMNCHYLSDEYYKVIELAHKSFKLAAKNNLNVPNGYSYHMLGQAYLALSSKDSERNYLDKSSDYNYKTKINKTASYLDSTKYFLDKGIEYSLEHNQSKELADNYLTMSDYYTAIGNLEKAKLYLIKSKEEKSYFDNSIIDKKLAKLWAVDKNYSKAYFHLNKYINHKSQKEKDSKKDLVLATKIIEDSYRYKEESQANLQTAKQKEKRLRNIIAIVLAGLLLIASLLIYVQKNRNNLKVLNKKIGQRNKELDILINKQKETIKYLDNFASVAAHDLKAPIRTASSFAGLLARVSGDKLNDKEKGYLKYIGTSVAQLSAMIDDLLSLSRLDSDLPEEKEINLKEIVLEVETLLSNLINQTESKIVIESTLPKILGHSTLISQLFQNLIKNSILHNNTGSITTIKINSEFKKDNIYTISISDNSGGIPEYMIPTIFDLFSSSDKNSGNGIGLATCKKIVNHYGGEIWVDVEPGVGSTFSFNLFS